MLTGKVITVEVSPSSETAEDLLYKIQDKEGISPDHCKLIFGSKQITESRYLNEYGITRESHLHLVMRLYGGGRGGRGLSITATD